MWYRSVDHDAARSARIAAVMAVRVSSQFAQRGARVTLPSSRRYSSNNSDVALLLVKAISVSARRAGGRSAGSSSYAAA